MNGREDDGREDDGREDDGREDEAREDEAREDEGAWSPASGQDPLGYAHAHARDMHMPCSRTRASGRDLTDAHLRFDESLAKLVKAF